MALDSDRPGRLEGLARSVPAEVREPLGRVVRRVQDVAGVVSDRAGPIIQVVLDWLVRQPVARFLLASLWRRIFLANLFGLVFLMLGSFWLSQHQAVLIEAKREALRIQGEIIAAAIASNAKIDRSGIVIDPDRLPEVAGSMKPFRDDAFAALELPMPPERINPVLRRLVKPTSSRARVYTQRGTLIADTASMRLHASDGTEALPPQNDARPGDGLLTTKNFWTRLTYWLIDKELQVYKELGNANGHFYPEVRKALSGEGTTAMMLLNERGEKIVSVAAPIQRLNTVHGVLLLSTKPGEIDAILYEQWLQLLTLAGLALAASIAASMLLARTVAGPMKQLSHAAEAVSRSITARDSLPDLSHREDEVGRLSNSFRAMTNSLIARIEASEKFAADVAHELKNPLTAARSTAEALAYAKTDEQREQIVGQIQGELARLNRLISDVSAASRLDAELARQHVDKVALHEVLAGVKEIFSDIAAERSGCRIELEIDPSIVDGAYVVNGNEGRLAQVFTNLVDNAVSFSRPGTVVRICARRKGGLVEIRIEDEGPGIPDGKLDDIFSRFYTYRPTAESSRGDNSGLGLSISREIVQAHQGRIWAENRFTPGQAASGKPVGARFVVELPAAGPTGQRAGNSPRGGVRGEWRA